MYYTEKSVRINNGHIEKATSTEKRSSDFVISNDLFGQRHW